MEKSPISPIAQLAELQQLDRARREKQLQIEALEAEISAIDVELERKARELETAREALQVAEAKHKELDAHLESEGSKMKDRRMRLNRVRNEKELQALRHEIEVGKELNQQVEEQVLQLMEQIESLSNAFQSVETGYSEGQSQLQERRQSNQEQVSVLRREIAQALEGRKSVTQALDRALLQKYEMIFERRAGVAVVEVRNGICLGCRMSLPPQFFNELQKTPDVRLCPNCHRILFWRPERLEQAP